MSTRRAFLRSIGAGAALAAAQPMFSRSLPVEGRGSDVADLLRARARAITAFDLRFTIEVLSPQTGWSPDALAVVAGPGEMVFDGTTYTATYIRNGFTIIERATASSFEQIIEDGNGARRVAYSGPPTATHHLRFSLKQFLPAPAAGAVREEPPARVRGEHARRLVQDDATYFVDASSRVVRFERRPAREALAETTEYEEFTDAAANLPFPTRIRSQRGGRSPLVLTVSHVRIEVGGAR